MYPSSPSCPTTARKVAALRGSSAGRAPRTGGRRRARPGRDGLVVAARRYAAGGKPLGEAEGAFLMRGFAVCLAEFAAGNVVEAFRWFERQRAACGPPGLFSEEFDVRQRQLRGNLLQGFVHALLLECSRRLGHGDINHRNRHLLEGHS